MILLNNDTSMACETDDNYMLYCCKYFEIFVMAEVSGYKRRFLAHCGLRIADCSNPPEHLSNLS